MPTHQPAQLPRREREIMDVLFGLGEAAAEDVRALLARLEAKGQIKHREEGLRYVYTPTVAPTAARRAALKQYVRTFFGGSVGDMLTSLLRSESWSDDELATLQDEINRARKERTK